MSNVKKNNHETTRAYLEQWAEPNAGVLSWIDLQMVMSGASAVIQYEQPKYKNGKRKSPAAFAVHQFAYVPQHPGHPDDKLEDIFSALETHMIDLCRARTQADVNALGRDNQVKAVAGCLSHAFRDVYALQHFYAKATGASIPTPARSFQPSVHAGLVGNLSQCLDVYQSLVDAMSWKIYRDLPEPLMTSDHACFDMSMRAGMKVPVIAFALSPDSMLIGMEGDYSISVQSGVLKKEMAAIWNRMVIARARHWIVGSHLVLAAHLHDLTPASLSQRVQQDKEVTLDLTQPRGYRIT